MTIDTARVLRLKADDKTLSIYASLDEKARVLLTLSDNMMPADGKSVQLTASDLKKMAALWLLKDEIIDACSFAQCQMPEEYSGTLAKITQITEGE